jgi:hypothetical protein
MRRHDNWPTLLTAFIEERRHSPFAWGSNDCCLFAADWIRRACGVDFAEDLRGRYSSALGATRILSKFGGVLEIATTLARLEKIPSPIMRRGDVVAFEMQGGYALGICCGDVAALVGKSGLVFPKTVAASAAWRL